MTVIASLKTLPGSPFNGSEYVGIAITSSVPTFIRVTGADLDDIESVNWYPVNPGSLKFTMRGMLLIDNTLGTFMVAVDDNYLDTTDRGGYISFRLTDGTTLNYPVKTFGRVSLTPLWTSPEQGLITG